MKLSSMTDRRKFIKKMALAGAASSMPAHLWSQQKPGIDKIWAYLAHLSYNMWTDHVPEEEKNVKYNPTSCEEAKKWAYPYRPALTFDESAWDVLLKDMASAGINMVVIDLGDGVRYESHPEIAVSNAWTTDKLRKELVKMKELGLEPIPKMNFSATHDIWLGKYSRMVSTDEYYKVCRDLISEVIELFDYPRFFHLGMDEETAHHQRRLDYIVIRQNDLWWGDLYFYIGEVEKKGVQPWVWSDYGWNHPEVFFRNMPKSVMQSNWYYGSRWDWKSKVDPKEKYPRWRTYVKMYNDLEEHGYDQIPTGSNHANDENMEDTVDYCKNLIDPSRLNGFMMTPWRPTLTPCIERHEKAIDQMKNVIQTF